MHDKDSPFPIADSHGRLECTELWGGIRNRDSEVSAGKEMLEKGSIRYP
ncbi:hypothetical protein D1BOALGB6SA_4073 [Olavius sp. associated proteobacterium Delta 1]|nr:hypothetical protein D1BOALGB6SA_4073 [Olavius sp. associated proteobacterium Delta 1]